MFFLRLHIDLKETNCECVIKLNLFGLGEGQVAIACGHGNESSGSIKVGECLDKLSDY
jgi:hypothetical protein